MKLINVCGGDNLGKSLLIKKLCEHFRYDNVTVRHCGKPPKRFPDGVSSLDWQDECFGREADLIHALKQMDDDEYNYYENVIIYNRFVWGEFVYGQMYRGLSPNVLENYVLNFEERNLLSIEDSCLILLTADPQFFLKKEDGQSFSQNISQKTTELKLFDEIFEKSNLNRKLRIKVNDGGDFLSKEYIFNKVIDFLEHQNDLI